MKKGKRLKKVLLTGLLIILFVSGIIYMGLQMKLKEISKEISNLEISNIDMTSIEDGIYQGEYYMDDLMGASIEVTVENHEIKSIDFLDHKYGKGKKAEAIVDTVIEKQSLDVDAVSGATGSSITILKAIENALIK